MGKLIGVGILLWFLMRPDEEAAAPQERPKDVGERVSGGLQDLTRGVEGATSAFRRVMTDGRRLTDAIERFGGAFSGGIRMDDDGAPQQSGGISGQDVTDYDQTYSAEDPTSWDSAPVRYT